MAWVVFAILLTIESWYSETSLVIGNWAGPDMAGTAWTWWWTAEALSSGQLPWSSSVIFYPVGLYPIGQLNLVDATLAAPLYWLFDPITAYRLAAVFMIASTAWAGETLCRWEGADRISSIFGGVALATSSYVAIELWTGRLSQIWLLPLILSLGLWRRLLSDRLAFRGALATGLMTGICFLSYWFYGFFLFLAVGLMALAGWKDWNRERWKLVGWSCGICLLLLVPPLMILSGSGSDLPGMDRAMTPGGEIVSGREASRLWAQDFSLWPWWIVGGSWSAESDISLGWPWLIVGFAPLVATWRSRKLWLAVALLGLILTLGPTLRGPEGTEWSSLSLPFAWLQDGIPYFYRMRWPYRAAAIVLPALAVVAALNLTELARELPRFHWSLSTVAILGLCWDVAFFTGSPIGQGTPYEEPGEAYAVLDGPVLVLPLRGDDDSVRSALWMQMWHKQPISYGIGGHIDGHRPVAWDQWLEDSDFLSDLAEYENWPPARMEIQPVDIDKLLDQGFRYVLVDSRHFRATTDTMMVNFYSEVLSETFGKPLVTDENARVWKIRPLESPVVLDPAPGAGR